MSTVVLEDRYSYLDGLRGIASLSVFFWHFFLAFYPFSVMPTAPSHSFFLEKILYPSPLNIFFGGDLAVYIFFVLSGFVISISFFKNESSFPNNMFLRRYIRLMPAAAVSVFFAYVLLSMGLMFNIEASKITGSWWLTLNWSQVSVNFHNMLYLGLYGTWFSPVSPGEQFNSNLGTLFIEIIASFLLYILIIIFRIIKASLCIRIISYFSLSITSFFITKGNLDFAVFFMGVMFADFMVNYQIFYSRIYKIRYIVLILGLYFASANIGNIGYSESNTFNIYHGIEIFFRSLGIHPLSGPWAVAAILILLATFSFNFVKKLFNIRIFQYLGEHSYSIYLIHTVLIGSIASYFILFFTNMNFSYNLSVMFTFIITSIFVFVFSHFLLIIDKYAVYISRKC